MYEVVIQYKNSKLPDKNIKFDIKEECEYFLKVVNKTTIKKLYVDNKLYYKTKPKINIFGFIVTTLLILTITAGSFYILNNPQKFSTTYQYHNMAGE